MLSSFKSMTMQKCRYAKFGCAREMSKGVEEVWETEGCGWEGGVRNVIPEVWGLSL